MNGSHEKETAAKRKYTLYLASALGDRLRRPTGNFSLPNVLEGIKRGALGKTCHHFISMDDKFSCLLGVGSVGTHPKIKSVWTSQAQPSILGRS